MTAALKKESDSIEGRDFRYPITFIDPEGNKMKRKTWMLRCPLE